MDQATCPKLFLFPFKISLDDQSLPLLNLFFRGIYGLAMVFLSVFEFLHL